MGADVPPPAPAERAFAFLSKSFNEVQRSAESDLKMMSERAEVIRKKMQMGDAADWESMQIRLPGPGGGQEVSAGKLLQKLKESSAAFAASRKVATLEDFDIFKNFKERSGARSMRRSSSLDLMKKKNGEAALEAWPAVRASLFHGSDFVRVHDWQAAVGGGGVMQQKLHEGDSDAVARGGDATVETGKQSFWRFSNNKYQAPATAVAPLDVPELLESLVRQTEPIFDQLKFGKDIPARLTKIIRKCHKKGSRSADNSPCVSQCASPTATSGDAAFGAAEGDELAARIASVQESTGYKYSGHALKSRTQKGDRDRRNIAIFTTASLPWMTGTAVNPLLRAAYLAETGEQDVTLVVPWLTKKEQESVYPNQITFDTPDEQERYVRDWLHARVGFSPDFRIAFYPGKFSAEKRSILAVGDISHHISDKEADVAVLEEPEHLTWYYHGRRWTEKFKDVVGIIHTNYLEYVRREKNGEIQALVLEHVNNWMMRAYCHKVVRLSAATQNLPRSVVCNVHGVGIKFLDIGSRVAAEQSEGKKPLNKGAYYLGKMVWSKGYRELIDLLALHKETLGGLKVDVFGSGEDSDAVQGAAVKSGLRMKFHKGRDHADPSLQQYKVFINPSMSDVVCTTTAEALAMGKIVVCADHPSNAFFRSFPNCLPYKTPQEFAERVQEAINREPIPLTEEQRHMLSWEAATDRFLDCAGLSKKHEMQRSLAQNALTMHGEDFPKDAARLQTLSLAMSQPDLGGLLDRGLFAAHFFLSGIEGARRIAGAVPDTMHCGPELSKELGLPPPSVQRPVYGW